MTLTIFYGGVNMDREMLKKYIDESPLNNLQIAQSLGISRSCWYRKRTGKTEFTLPEIIKCCNILNIGKTDKESIFFNEKVS